MILIDFFSDNWAAVLYFVFWQLLAQTYLTVDNLTHRHAKHFFYWQALVFLCNVPGVLIYKAYGPPSMGRRNKAWQFSIYSAETIAIFYLTVVAGLFAFKNKIAILEPASYQILFSVKYQCLIALATLVLILLLLLCGYLSREKTLAKPKDPPKSKYKKKILGYQNGVLVREGFGNNEDFIVHSVKVN